MVIFVIKDIRSEKNINLYKLSKLTGITRSYLRDLENNKKNNVIAMFIYNDFIVE